MSKNQALLQRLSSYFFFLFIIHHSIAEYEQAEQEAEAKVFRVSESTKKKMANIRQGVRLLLTK